MEFWFFENDMVGIGPILGFGVAPSSILLFGFAVSSDCIGDAGWDVCGQCCGREVEFRRVPSSINNKQTPEESN